MSRKQPAIWLIMLLASVIATTPLSIDMYLPAMPMMAEQLHTHIGLVQQSLSIFLAAYATGMLIAGPLADAIGRRPLALFGLSGFAVTSFILSQQTSIESFLIWRGIQAFCGACATVVIPGIVRHLYQENTAKGMSYVAMIMMLAPLLAPAIGSGILLFGGWQLIFIALMCYSSLILFLSWRFLPETKISGSPTKFNFFNGYKIVFSLAAARPYLTMSLFSSFAFFCFITAVSFVYIQYYGVSEQMFVILFGINVIMLMTTNFLNSRLSTTMGTQRMLRIGIFTASVSVTLLVFAVFFAAGLWYTVIAVSFLMGSLSLISVNADAIVLMKFPENSGTATAVQGTMRYGSGAVAGPLLALFYDGTPLPFALLMLAGVIGIGCAQFWKRMQG